MKDYCFKLDGKKRICGYCTNDKDLSLSYFKGNKLIKEQKHYHKESEEVYIPTKGEGILMVKNKKIKLKPGMIVRVNKKEPHKIIKAKNLEIYVLKIPDKYDDKVLVE